MLLIALALVALVAGGAWAALAPISFEKQIPGMRGALIVSVIAFILGAAAIYFWQASWGVPLVQIGLPVVLIAGGLRVGGALARKLFVTV